MSVEMELEAAERQTNGEASSGGRPIKGGKPYMSIGEVLNILKVDYADVTISKIRFLETEQLIDPERTASGYRKFYQADLDRLRFILRLQRDSYLPLKVIRERLAEYDAGTRPTETATTPKGAAQAPRPEVEDEESLTEAATAVQMSEGELAGATGLELTQIHALREFGILCSHGPTAASYYDGDDVILGRIARDFIALGIEPRHMRMFKQFAEREAALFEGAVLPLMHNRNADSRKQAAANLAEMTRLSKKMRHAFLRQSLRAYLTAGDLTGGKGSAASKGS